jgi:GNAT superfamily N-acetyltransferase
MTCHSRQAIVVKGRDYPGRVRIEVLSAVGRWDHFASLMVPGKPGGSGCVCMAYRNSSLDTPGRVEHMRELCGSEPGPGVLAFADGEAVGWCSIAPKATYRALVNSRTIPHVDDAHAWSAVCFRVRPGFRRKGLTHTLLDGAVEHARASGAIVIEGYPVDPQADRVDQISAYVGTVRLFEAHGFRRVQQTTGRSGGKSRWLVRRELPSLPGTSSACSWAARSASGPAVTGGDVPDGAQLFRSE